MVAEVMPEQTEQTKQPVFKVERGKLAQALEWCLRAVCKDKQRPILCGVHFDHEMQSVLASDMHRAHVATGFCLPCSFTLATDSAKGLLKELKKAVATVIHFHTEGCELVSGQWRGELIEGDFPRVDRVTPKEDEREASAQFIATDDLCAVLKYAGQCPSYRKNFQLPVNFQVGGKKVSVWHDVNETQVAFMHSEAECNTEGDTVTIFCRPSYLRDALLHLNRRSTFTSPQLDFWADLSPFVIRHNDRELYAVIMPCQRAVERSR